MVSYHSKKDTQMDRRTFLTWLYEYCEGGQVETRALPYPQQAFHKNGDWDSVDDFCEAHFNKNLYYAVASRNGGGTKDHISEIPAVWADIDWKDFPGGFKEARKILFDFPLKPSLVIDTGGGYHALWRLKEPAGKEEIPAIEKILRAIATHLNADQNATDASRILRLPETINHKYDDKPAVKIAWKDNLKLEYNPEDFEDLQTPTELLNTIERVSVHGDFEIPAHSPAMDKGGQLWTGVDNLHSINFSVGHHDETLFSLAWHLAKSKMQESEVLKVIEYIAKTLDPVNETSKWAKEKTRSAFTRLTHREGNLSEEILAWVMESSGQFCGQDVDKELQMWTKVDKMNRRKVLQRLVKKEILEKVQGKNNTFRRIEKDCDPIDFLNAPTEEVDITLPLGLTKFFRTFRKNIIIFAGAQDAGKTALLLNFVRDNMDKHEIHYFSSEMAETEMKVRLENFPNILLEDWTFFPHERSDNFADVIKPNAINVIDYLEMHDTFYDIAGKLRGIHDRLNQGIAIVAIQKDPKKEHGRGDSFGLEKPRLYVTIDNDFPGHVAKIIKCKNWRDSDNPKGKEKHFKLVGGCKLVEETGWLKDID